MIAASFRTSGRAEQYCVLVAGAECVSMTQRRGWSRLLGLFAMLAGAKHMLTPVESPPRVI
jgi:hypothetical protein